MKQSYAEKKEISAVTSEGWFGSKLGDEVWGGARLAILSVESDEDIQICRSELLIGQCERMPYLRLHRKPPYASRLNQSAAPQIHPKQNHSDV